MFFLKARPLSLLFFTISFSAFGQSVFVPLNQEYSHLIDRYEIKSGALSNDFHSNVKPFDRLGVIKLTERVEATPTVFLTEADEFNLQYLKNDSWEWLKDKGVPNSDNPKPILQEIYKKRSDFFQIHNDDIDIHINPVFYYGGGKDFVDRTANKDLFINTRGVEVRGVLNQKLGFYTFVSENQATQPTYVADYIRSIKGIPYEGFTKVVNDDSTQMKIDYFSARGYLVFRPMKSLQLQFGHDRNFIGSGVRSMILSDFSSPYLQLKANVQVGRLQYMTIFGQMLNNQLARPAFGNIPITTKYLAFHHLNVNVFKNLNVGIFETVMFGKRLVGFDPNYINPIILYRFVEGLLGSSDNVIVGADFKWNFLQRFSLYGQFVLDELNRSASTKGDGWWAKKYGGQVGLKYIDVLGINNLDLQLEGNFARPYLYSHFSTYSNFVHYNVPAAHPLGANFREALAVLRYQPIPRLSFNATAMLAQTGKDKDGLNYGSNILRLNSDSRANEFGVFITQGQKQTIAAVNFTASYMLFHNFFLEIDGTYRNLQSADTAQNQENISATGGIRWNIGRLPKLF